MFRVSNPPRYNNSLFCESNPFRPIALARLYCCLRTTHTTPDLADDAVLHSRTAEQFHSSLPLYAQTLTLNCCDSYWSLSLLNTPSVTFFTAPTTPTDTSMICSLFPPPAHSVSKALLFRMRKITPFLLVSLGILRYNMSRNHLMIFASK